MPLLDLARFDPIGDLLGGKKIIYAPGQAGVAGDMIAQATERLFALWDVEVANDWRAGDFPEVESQYIDFFVYGGGGTLGTMYQEALIQRQWLVERFSNLPVVVLPQSYTGGNEFKPSGLTIFCREQMTLDYFPGGVLAPELALALDCEAVESPPMCDHGLFLREDQERRMVRCYPRHLGDPVTYCKTWKDYLRLAARFEAITTDRLHFAICGLMLNRKVTLLPNKYPKNRSMYETWLRDLGCRWLETRF